MGDTFIKSPCLFAVSGYKNTGKTKLITELIPLLKIRGYQIATIKHDGHDFTPDVPGRDSYRHREAGACGTAVFSDQRLMVVMDCKTVTVEILAESFKDADVILLEGFKNSDYPGVTCNYPKEILDPKKVVDMIIECINGTMITQKS